MRRLACLSLLTATIGAAALAPASEAAVTWGVSDQQASTFTNPLFKPLKLKGARYVAPWDVVSDATQKARFDAWYNAANQAGESILVSFEHSRTAGAQTQAPPVATYEKAMKAFKALYPKVAAVNTWNEVNACQRSGETERQPLNICKPNKAKLLVQYYGVSRKVFKNKKIIPLDVLDDKSPTSAVNYVKAFKKALKGKNTPKVWGLHNYSDTNRFSQSRTKKIIKAFGGKGEVWLLETGGQLSLLKTEAKQAKALQCMFYIAKQFKQIKKGFIYQFNGAAPGQFDAGLISTTNQIRPAYTVVKKRQAKKCG